MYAKGIPDKNKYGDLRKLRAKSLVRYTLQKHYSARNKRDHYDLRLGSPELGLYSWAIPKARMPEDKEKLLAVRTPLHKYDYNNFTGNIPKGRGAGRVTMSYRGMAEILKSTPKTVEYRVKDTETPQRFKLIRTNKNKRMWILINRDKADEI